MNDVYGFDIEPEVARKIKKIGLNVWHESGRDEITAHLLALHAFCHDIGWTGEALGHVGHANDLDGTFEEIEALAYDALNAIGSLREMLGA